MNKAFEKILERFEEKLKKSEERYHRYLDDSNLPCMFDKSDIEETRVDTIKEMLEIVQEVSEEYNGGWIPCSDRLPEESLNSVIGWDEYRQRCCFVQYYGGRWILGNDIDSVKIIAWQPLPEPYKERD